MNSRFLISGRELGAFAFVLIPLFVSGCSIWQNAEREKLLMPHVNGTWTGRIEVTDVSSHREPEVAYKALQLKIIRGPTFPEDFVPLHFYVGGGTTPLLARVVEGSPELLMRGELPEGALVEVRGSMFVTVFVCLPRTARGTQGRIVNRKPDSNWTPQEHVILLKGRPRIINADSGGKS